MNRSIYFSEQNKEEIIQITEIQMLCYGLSDDHPFADIFPDHLTVSSLLALSLRLSSIMLFGHSLAQLAMGHGPPFIYCKLCLVNDSPSWGYCPAAWEGSILNSWTAEFCYGIIRQSE